MDRFAPIATPRHSGPMPLSTTLMLGASAIALLGFLVVPLVASVATIGGTQGLASSVLVQMGWVISAVILAHFFPLGIRPTVTLATTVQGLLMDAPSLIYAGLIFATAWSEGLFTQGFGWFWPLLVALAVGFGEEFLFRVVLLGWLVTKLPVLRALILSALIFGFAHMSDLTLTAAFNTLPQFSAGILFGAIYLRTRNILGPALAHAWWDYPIFVTVWNSGDALQGPSGAYGVLDPASVLLYGGFTVWGLFLMRPLIGVDGRSRAAIAELRSAAPAPVAPSPVAGPHTTAPASTVSPVRVPQSVSQPLAVTPVPRIAVPQPGPPASVPPVPVPEPAASPTRPRPPVSGAFPRLELPKTPFRLRDT